MFVIFVGNFKKKSYYFCIIFFVNKDLSYRVDLVVNFRLLVRCLKLVIVYFFQGLIKCLVSGRNLINIWQVNGYVFVWVFLK